MDAVLTLSISIPLHLNAGMFAEVWTCSFSGDLSYLQIILLSFQCECKWHRQNVPLLCGKLILVSILILQPSLGANGCGSGWFMFRCWIKLINVFKMGLETGLGCTYYYCRSSIGAHWSRSGNTIMWTSGAAISSLISAQPVPSIFHLQWQYNKQTIVII